MSMENTDSPEIFERGRVCTILEGRSMTSESTYVGRGRNETYMFVAKADSMQARSRGEYKVLTLRKGTFISDGEKIFPQLRESYFWETRTLNEREEDMYIEAKSVEMK